MIKIIRYIFEYIGVVSFYTIFKILPVRTASNFGGWVGRNIGPLLPITARVRKHLALVYPAKTEAERNTIMRGMWETLGHLVAEYPHLDKMFEGSPHIDVIVEGREHLDAVAKSGKGAVFFTGHYGNWEVGTLIIARTGIPLTCVYRAPNNPWVDRLLLRCRQKGTKQSYVPKSQSGMRDLVRSLKSGRSMAILIDQKYNQGIEVPFLGHPAMTSTSFADLAQKFDIPLIPTRIKRLDGPVFQVTFYDPVETKTKSGKKRPVGQIVAEANRHLEDWIHDAPGQWLWLHRRWKKKL